jgi:hypothetical protein
MMSAPRLALNPAILHELKYQSRHAWVAAKEVLGLSRRGDQTFYVDRFVRSLRNGSITPGCKIMATGRGDGAGSQAQAAMSAICLAVAHGREYIHSPITSTSIEHAETEMSEWARQCEEYFNLGHGSQRIGESIAPIVPVDKVLKDPRVRSGDVVVSAPHYLHYCNQDTESWERALPILRQKYRANKTKGQGGAFTVAVHMRRGTVSLESYAVAFTPNAVFLRALEALTAILSKRVGDLRIRVFSQGDAGMFEDLRRFGCELVLDEPSLLTHRQLADADVLIMSKGAYSYTAGVLNEGISIYDPQKYRSLRDWIVRTPDGLFDAVQFSEQLDRHLSARRRAT